MYHGVLGWFGGIGTTLYSALFYPILLWVVIHLLKRITTTLPLFQAWLGDDENRPVEIGWVTISWYTTSLNRTFRYATTLSNQQFTNGQNTTKFYTAADDVVGILASIQYSPSSSPFGSMLAWYSGQLACFRRCYCCYIICITR